MNSYFKSFIALALVALVPTVSAVGCFHSGQVGDCSAAIDPICNMINGVAFLAGQTISTCVDLPGYRCNMAVKNTGGGGSVMGFQQCRDNNIATNNGCGGQGGIRADGNFQLTLDPNTGAC